MTGRKRLSPSHHATLYEKSTSSDAGTSGLLYWFSRLPSGADTRQATVPLAVTYCNTNLFPSSTRANMCGRGPNRAVFTLHGRAKGRGIRTRNETNNETRGGPSANRIMGLLP